MTSCQIARFLVPSTFLIYIYIYIRMVRNQKGLTNLSATGAQHNQNAASRSLSLVDEYCLVSPDRLHVKSAKINLCGHLLCLILSLIERSDG